MVFGISSQLAALKEALAQKEAQLEKSNKQLRKFQNLLFFGFLDLVYDVTRSILVSTDEHKVSVIGANVLECCEIANKYGCKLIIENKQNEVIVYIKCIYGFGGVENVRKEIEAVIQRHEMKMESSDTNEIMDTEVDTCSSFVREPEIIVQQTTTTSSSSSFPSTTTTTTKISSTTSSPPPSPPPSTTTTEYHSDSNLQSPTEFETPKTSLSPAVAPSRIHFDEKIIRSFISKLGLNGIDRLHLKQFICALLDENRPNVEIPSELQDPFNKLWNKTRFKKKKYLLKRIGGTIHTIMLAVPNDMIYVSVAVVHKRIVAQQIGNNMDVSNELLQSCLEMDPLCSKCFKIDPEPILTPCKKHSKRKTGLVSLHRRFMEFMIQNMACFRQEMNLSSIPAALAIHDSYVKWYFENFQLFD